MELLTPEDILKHRGVGLTGSVATGKTTVGNLLRELGYLVIDADQLARDAVKPGSKGLMALVGEFGSDILQVDGTLNRKKMRSLMIANEKNRETLELILHPAIRNLLSERLHTLGRDSAKIPIFYEAALIFERERQGDFREVWVTHCSPHTQLTRLMARDQVGEGPALGLIASQWPSARKAELANVVIDTEGSTDSIKTFLKEQLQRLHAML